MRQLLVILLGSLLVAFAASCSSSASEPETPTTVLIAADTEFADKALELANEILAPRGMTAALAAGAQSADLTVSREPGSGLPFVTGYWAVATALSNPRQDITIDELRQEPFTVPEEFDPPIERWLGTTARVQPEPLEEIPSTLQAQPGTLALLPLDALDARVAALSVDGSDILFGDTRERDTYPLVEQGWVTATVPEGDPDFALILEQTATGLAKRLGVEYGTAKPIILRATGDVIPSRCVYEKQLGYNDFSHAFRELGSWLSQADVTVGSLDASISDAGRPFGCEPTFSLLAPARSVEGLAYAGFDVITVATNHAKDCGRDACGDQAFFDTLDNLRANGIEPVGGGADLTEARAPVVIDVRGTRFAFLGADQIAAYYHAGPGVAGTAPLDETYLAEDVAAARKIADVVIVLPHWGVEYTDYPTDSQQSLAAAAIGAGAGLVIGNHPHWVQAVDPGDGTFIAYSLGNFVFDQDWSVPTQQGVVLEAAFLESELKGVRLVPVRIIDMHQPTFAEPAEAQQILDRIWATSAQLP